jgi:hypothetical protein
MARTIKVQKTLTMRPAKPEESAETREAAAEPEAPSSGAVYVSGPAPGAIYVAPVVLAAVAVLLFAALLVVQWREFSHYTSPPSAFPLGGIR